MNEAIVTIIIPCYNVGKYVEKCITSIMAQSYEDIEIITVNDGSKDDTLSILESLASKDNRIHIINKENAGVSAARNSGLENATGEYVVFVDGDDYLAPDYVEYMLSLTESADADFVMSKNCFTRETEPQVNADMHETLSPTEATALLISPRVIVGCWNKMYKMSFLKKFDIKFSTTLFYGEGLNFITKASQIANCVTVGERKVYYYRRNNEASATSKFNIQKYYNGEKALDNIQQELIVHDKDVDLMMALHKSLFCTGALSQTYAHGLQKTYLDDCNHWRTIIKENLGILLKSNKVSMYRKTLLMCVYCFPGLVSKLDMWRRKRIAERSIY
ncbi:MAG: glycosyltransferase family 2 protein [Candidatus Aphodosoma sp.]